MSVYQTVDEHPIKGKNIVTIKNRIFTKDKEFHQWPGSSTDHKMFVINELLYSSSIIKLKFVQWVIMYIVSYSSRHKT